MSSFMASSSPALDQRGTRRPLRRLTLELLAIVALKIAALMLIWWVAFAPHPKPDASADAIAHRLAPSPHTPPAGHP
jgi:hypothetical protein